MNSWYVYLLHCVDNTLYCGIAKQLEKRVAFHNQKKASRYTRTRVPVQLVYWEEQPNHSAALKREAQIKRLTRKGKDCLISSNANQQTCQKQMEKCSE